MKSNKIIIGAILCLIASVSWGAMFPVSERALVHIDPFYFSFIRYGSVSILLVIWLIMKEGVKSLRLEGKLLPLWFFGTMAFTVYNFFVFLGQKSLGKPGVILASIMEAMIPLIAVLILWFFKHQRPSNFTLGCIAIAFIGVFMVITKGDLSFFSAAGSGPLWVFVIFIGEVGWAVYTLGCNSDSFDSWSSLRYSTLSCVLGSLTAGLFVAIMTGMGYIEIPTAGTLFTIKWEMVFMILVAGLIALISWNVGIKYLNPINGSLFINFVPVTTLVISMIQGYELTLYDMAGTVLIIVALVCNNLYQRRMLQDQLPAEA